MAGNDTLVNNRSPVTEKSSGTIATFPDVCKTQCGPPVIPIPYPNISQSSNLAKGSKKVKVNKASVCLESSEISSSTGDEAGAIGGIVSGKTRGKAYPIMSSFDVKIEGKGVVRNFEPFVSNERNTPPGPVMQAQQVPVIPVPEKDSKTPCEYCGKDQHEFAKHTGSHIGASQTLRKNIIAKVENHAWYTGGFSVAAHHLICSEAMDDDDWPTFCRQFGYNINHKKNGVMLPMKMVLACQLHVALHNSNHSAGSGGGVSYPKRIKQELDKISSEIKSGKYCTNPNALIDKLNNLSKIALNKIDKFTWTITADGRDYDSGNCGCAGATKIPGKTNQPCPQGRNHGLTRKNQTTVIPRKIQPLEIGK